MMFSRRPPTDTKLFLQYQNWIRSSRIWFFCWRIAAMGKLWMQKRGNSASSRRTKKEMHAGFVNWWDLNSPS